MQKLTRRGAGLASAAVLAVMGCGTRPAAAQEFFAGKTVSIFAGRPPGGGVDSEMRLVAQFLGEQLPGHPRMVAQNMPGAGGIALGNYLFNIATGRLVCSMGGGNVYVKTGQWSGDKPDWPTIRALEAFIVANPDGGDVTHIVPQGNWT
jgi:tripartite-type tricarboxylate transporter receptor subunit TctC